MLCTTQQSIRNILTATGATKSMIFLLKKEVQNVQGEHLVRLMNLRQMGKKTVLSEEEERMVAQRICYAATRGIAIEHNVIKRITVQMARDGRPGWRNDVLKSQVPQQNLQRS